MEPLLAALKTLITGIICVAIGLILEYRTGLFARYVPSARRKVVASDQTRALSISVKPIHDNNLEKGIRIDGMLDGIPLQIVASDWERFGGYGYVVSGWPWLST